MADCTCNRVGTTCHHADEAIIDWIDCPGCGGPAEITDRAVLQSTDGPVEHVRVFCISRACNPLRMPTGMLRRQETACEL